jgi:hypothetical protein
VSGKLAPETVNPPPLIAAALTVTGAFPVELSVMARVAPVLTETLPNDTLVALTPSVGTYAPSCNAKLSPLLLVVAVRITACAVLTALAAAVKFALLVPAGICTLAGTATAASLLSRLTFNPPDGALPFNVTVQPSVAAPVSEELTQLSDFRVGRSNIVPVPLRPIVMDPLLDALLAIFSCPVAVPVVLGSNCTFNVMV